MALSFTAVVLAGGIRPCPLCEELGTPVLCLPVTDDQTLLTAWLTALSQAGACQGIRIAVTDEADGAEICDQLQECRGPRRQAPDIEVVQDPSPWRGTGGIVRDVSENVPDGHVVLAVEAACLPPRSLDSLLDALEPNTAVTVGIGGADEPAGVYAFRRVVLERIPKVGYFDIKEQLLPVLYERDYGVRLVAVTDRVLRIRDRASYLQAVFSASGRRPPQIGAIHCSTSASVSSSALLGGVCVIGRGAIVKDNAVVHNSVVLSAAVIGAGAIISRSIIGANVEIAAGSMVIDTVAASRNGQPGSTKQGGALASNRSR